MSAHLLAALAAIRDLHAYSDADVLRDALNDAKRVAGEALKTHKRDARTYAERVAARLFPDDAADGIDCHGEIGREGLPCRVCAIRNDVWALRVAEVRAALDEK